MPDTNQPNAGDTKMGRNKQSTRPQAERHVQTDSTDQGGNIQVAQGAIQVYAALTFFRALAAQCGCHVGDRENFREMEKNSFGVQRPAAFFSMPFSTHLKSKWFKACIERKENLHAQIILLLLPGVEPPWHESSPRRQSPSPLKHWGLIF